MPGLVGCITRLPRAIAENSVLQMLEVLRHEDFYATGMCADESLGIYVGWTTPKGSFTDGMPLWNVQRDVMLAFSGQEFPDPRLQCRLREQGHDFDRTGPAYLVH